MNLLKLISCVFFFTFLLGCKKEKEIQPTIIGRWEAVYQKGSATIIIDYNLSGKFKNTFFDFKENGQFREYSINKINGKDTVKIIEESPFRLTKDSLIFAKRVDAVRISTYDYYYKYKIVGDTLTLIEDLQTSHKNTENRFTAASLPQILTRETIQTFGRIYKDYYLEKKLVKAPKP